jgi:DnaJ family protein C protein 28
MAEDAGDSLVWTEAVAERKIKEAMEEGLFDNLPGAGKPLDLTENPFEPPGMAAVNRLLKNNNVLPAWLLLEKEIEASRAAALAVLARWEASVEGLRAAPDYARFRSDARSAYERHMRHTNDLILKYNYSNPFVYRSMIPFMIKRRLAEFDEMYGDVDSAGDD